MLESSSHELNTAAGGVPETRATDCPEPGRWSVLDLVEHVTGTEERFYSRLEHARRHAEQIRETRAALGIGA